MLARQGQKTGQWQQVLRQWEVGVWKEGCPHVQCVLKEGVQGAGGQRHLGYVVGGGCLVQGGGSALLGG